MIMFPILEIVEIPDWITLSDCNIENYLVVWLICICRYLHCRVHQGWTRILMRKYTYSYRLLHEFRYLSHMTLSNILLFQKTYHLEFTWLHRITIDLETKYCVWISRIRVVDPSVISHIIFHWNLALQIRLFP